MPAHGSRRAGTVRNTDTAGRRLQHLHQEADDDTPRAEPMRLSAVGRPVAEALRDQVRVPTILRRIGQARVIPPRGSNKTMAAAPHEHQAQALRRAANHDRRTPHQTDDLTRVVHEGQLHDGTGGHSKPPHIDECTGGTQVDDVTVEAASPRP